MQEALRCSLEVEKQEALRSVREELEECQQRAAKEKEELQEEVQALQHARDQRLLQAESEKQQVRHRFSSSVFS